MTMFFELGDYGEDYEFYFDDDQKVRCPFCGGENVVDVKPTDPLWAEGDQYRCQDCGKWWSET